MARKTDGKITHFTTSNLDLLRRKVEEALAPLGERCNLVFTAGRITYGDDTAKVT
jgi:hypothetical protein